MQKVKEWRSKPYLKWIRSLNCCQCGTDFNIAAHHIIGVSLGGAMGSKISDIAAIPLCGCCHQLLHNGNLKQCDQLYHQAKTVIKASNEGVLNA